MNNIKLSCIGAGNMGTALIKGLIESKAMPAKRITATDINKKKLSLLSKSLKIKASSDNAAAVEDADVVVLAVKPQIFDKILKQIKPSLSSKALIISVAAGYPTSLIEKQLGRPHKVVRAMPNISATVRMAATAICPGKYAKTRDLSLARKLFECCGMVEEVEENLMDAVTGLSGTGPMYVFIIIEALSDAGVRVGLSREIATRMATQTVLGAAKMVEQTGRHPIYLKDLVTSPGGTAINALYSMEKTGLRAVLMDAVETATRRSEELGRPFNGDNKN
jgi:pyrroline-5-carboxylate reductase